MADGINLTFNKARSLREPLPIEQYDKILSELDTRYRENKKTADQIEILAKNLEVAPGDEEIKQTEVQRLMTELDALSKKGDYENLSAQVEQQAKAFATNQDLRVATQNYKTIAEQREEAHKLALAGKQPLQFSNPEGFKSKNEDGSYNYFRKDVQEQLDYDTRMTKIYQDVLPDAVESGLLTASQAEDLRNGTLEIVTPQVFRETAKGITADKIKQFEQMAFSRYANTPEYGQQFRKVAEIEQMYADVQDPAMRNELIQDEIKKQLTNVGLMRTFKIQGYEGGMDTTLAQQRYAAKKAEEERKAAEIDAKITIGLGGQGIINPMNYSNRYEDYVTQYQSSVKLADAVTKEIVEKEKVLASQTLKGLDYQKAEKELTELKIQRDFHKKLAEDTRRMFSQDYVEYLRNPVGTDGNPINVDNSSTGKLTELQSKAARLLKLDMDIGTQSGEIFGASVTNTPGQFSPINSEQLKTVLTGLEEGKPKVEEIKKILLDSSNSRAELFRNEYDKSARIDGRVDEILNRLLSSLEQPNAYSSGSTKLTSKQAEEKFLNELTALEKAYGTGKGFTKEDISKIVNAARPLISIASSVSDIDDVLNDEDNIQSFLDVASSKVVTPTVYDFSTSLTDVSKSSKVADNLSRIASNSPRSFVMFDESGMKTTPENISKIEVTGVTDFVPGQGYMLYGKYYDTDPTQEKQKLVPHFVYMKPTTGLLDSNVTNAIVKALANSEAYEGESARGLELARAIQEEHVDKQFDRFRIVPTMNNQSLDTDVVLSDDLKFKASRETDALGRTTFTAISQTPNKDGVYEEVKFNDLETMVSAFENMQKRVNKLPVDDTAAARTNNPFSLSDKGVDGKLFGVPFTGQYYFNGTIDMPIFNTMEDGFTSGVNKLSNVLTGNSRNPAYKKDMSLYDFRKTYVGGEHEKSQMINVLHDNFYNDVPIEELQKMPINKIPVEYLAAAITKSEVSAKVFRQEIAPILEKYYGIKL